MSSRSIKILKSAGLDLDTILHSIPGHVYWLDKENQYIGCNQEQALSLGLSSSDEIVGKTPYDFSPKEIADEIVANNNQVMQSGKTAEFEERDNPLENKGLRYFYTKKLPLYNQKNELIGLLGISVDVTKQKKIRQMEIDNLSKLTIDIIGRDVEETQDSFELANVIRNFLQTIIAHMPGHVYWKNREGKILGCNNNMIEFFGFTKREEIIGKTDYEFQPQENAEIITNIDQQVMNSGHELFIEEPHPNDPLKGFLAHKTPLRGQNNEIIGVLSVSIDISERKKIEHSLQQAKETAETASAAKTEFIKNMSHDIRTPLNGIMGMAQLLEMRETDPEKHGYIVALLDSSKRLATLLTEIVELISMESGDRPVKYGTIHLKEMLDDVVKLMAPQATYRKLNISYEYSPDLPAELLSDKLRIHRIILNLVSNALKFTNQGSIKINVKPHKTIDDEIWIELSVVDTGIGIPSDQTETIFGRFTKIRSSYKRDDYGFGLGLYIVKLMVTELNGSIKVKSKVNEGSTFTCLLPFKNHTTLETETQPTTKIEDDIPKIHPKKILLIEDNKICQVAENQILTELQCDVDIANNGSEAIKFLQDNQYDLILLDIGLPDIDGITLAETIRLNIGIKTPIIATTAHSWDTKKYQEVQINDHLRKPISLQGFQHIIRQYA